MRIFLFWIMLSHFENDVFLLSLMCFHSLRLCFSGSWPKPFDFFSSPFLSFGGAHILLSSSLCILSLSWRYVFVKDTLCPLSNLVYVFFTSAIALVWRTSAQENNLHSIANLLSYTAIENLEYYIYWKWWFMHLSQILYVLYIL